MTPERCEEGRFWMRYGVRHAGRAAAVSTFDTRAEAAAVAERLTREDGVEHEVVVIFPV